MISRDRLLGQKEQHRLRVAWESHDENPHFFTNLAIASDGGFNEVPELYSCVRWFYALLVLAFAGLNVSMILRGSYLVLFAEGSWVTRQKKGFLFTNMAIDEVERIRHKIEGDNSDHDVKAEVLLAFFEAGLVSLVLLRSLRHFLFAIFCCDPVRRWHAVARLFWHHIPALASISAMRMLGFVVPAVLIPSLTKEIKRNADNHIVWRFLGLMSFLVFRMAALMIGCDTFLVKFRLVAPNITVSRNEIDLWNVISMLAFLNQLLGIVQVNYLTKKRLLLFMFGGVDGEMDNEEDLIQRTFHAMLSREIWRQYNCFLFCVIMLTYGDDDFQKMVLNPKAASYVTPNMPHVASFGGDVRCSNQNSILVEMGDMSQMRTV